MFFELFASLLAALEGDIFGDNAGIVFGYGHVSSSLVTERFVATNLTHKIESINPTQKKRAAEKATLKRRR